MIRRGLLIALLPGAALAGSWEFSAPLEVTGVHGEGIFHHLESSGRRSIAADAERVAITWEDERDGTPRAYLASRRHQDAAFATLATPVSDTGEAYEPIIAALGARRFALGWEGDATARVRLLSFDADGAASLGPPLQLSSGEAGQVSLAPQGDQLLAVWTERDGRHRRVRFARLRADAQDRLKVAAACAVDGQPASDDQLYPTLAVTQTHTVVAWEDRRPGHTIIMAAHAEADRPCPFSAPQRISEQPPGPKPPFGKGHGVSRVALASYGDGQVLAAWADKRDFRHGYDIYGAPLQADGGFGANLRLQDDFGELSQQWHTALAGRADGLLVAAWDDNRDRHAEIMLSWPEGDAWSDDLPVPGASGPGEQQHPSLTFDPAGRLHLAWVHRDSPGGPTRLRYSVGRYRAGD